jgi:hypothetical protein
MYFLVQLVLVACLALVMLVIRTGIGGMNGVIVRLVSLVIGDIVV